MSNECFIFLSLSLPKSLNKRESERKTADFFIFCSSLTMSRNKQEEDPRINGIKTKIRVVPDFPKKGNFFFCIFLFMEVLSFCLFVTCSDSSGRKLVFLGFSQKTNLVSWLFFTEKMQVSSSEFSKIFACRQ